MCTFDDLVARVLARAAEPGTSVVGITGAPGVGKSTLTESLLVAARARLGVAAVAQVPMDGFHLADVELRRLGRLDRKGAPDTFDVAGYAALLRRIRTRTEVVYVPGFERDVEQPIAGAIPVFPETAVVLTEGNYLLLDDPGWSAVAAEIDEIWYCAIEDDVRLTRLVDRHIAFGKPAYAARRWVAEVDEPNARLVAATAERADLVVRLAGVTIQ
ncbi:MULTISPECIES: nucleoside/nucleotide kinase family protein [unclassified Mycolicibacterium]|uniref:nucleoside/nucleotide kinase family protein n=1 Tax=unclassified Mycolicibacterium TaxID=2636767 RepID=UPI0012DFC9A3|nr:MULTISPECIES: nucleoside/nucleotide kinase family protein [unclassified Mycolicibacterium]MUL83293.1 nucleoside/nucleotide kinase family protein [Mycolicibacterium sp. CBMA 329]MUL90284.1 nucleoside/nucleotide kinase family protein [Mycolicibacterium sp. CBMA 331]MUM00258.1 nucleoside/nucleotide kinase family protein [Mycolicibacterium sp. CBMA 334]MUM26535.1 nucleoside/nucleotide kinase family protein [Mycolicibacterium sp. CBMA 295]MUM41228.1 nucleoside/nucleotide kinase family protein [M